MTDIFGECEIFHSRSIILTAELMQRFTGYFISSARQCIKQTWYKLSSNCALADRMICEEWIWAYNKYNYEVWKVDRAVKIRHDQRWTFTAPYSMPSANVSGEFIPSNPSDNQVNVLYATNLQILLESLLGQLFSRIYPKYVYANAGECTGPAIGKE